MADQRMQIIAEMIDKVTPAARRMQKSFEDLQKASAREFPTAFKKYQSAVVGNEKALVQFTKRSEGIRREIKAFQDIVARTSPTIFELTRSLGTFALGTGAAVGAIGAVGLALVEAGKSAADFAKSMKEIKFGSEETGLGKRQLIQIIQALGEYNISQEQTVSSFTGLRAAMTKAQYQTGKFMETIAPFGEDALILARPIIDLIKSGKTTAEVYTAITKELDKIEKLPGGEDLKRRFVQMFGMDPDLGRVGFEALKEQMELIEKLGSTGEEIEEAAKVAKVFNDKLFEIETVTDKWLTLVGTNISDALLYINTVMDKLKDTFGVSRLRQLGILLAPVTGGASASASAFAEWWASTHGLPKFGEGGIVTKPTIGVVGDSGPETVMPYFLGMARHYDKPTVTTLGASGPEQVIPDRAHAFIRAIGRTETDFSRSEAYSDALNKASNNAGVRQYGTSGADYGYYQMNQRDVAEAIKFGVPPEVAGHLAGGSQSTFAPARDMSTLEQQTGAVNELLKRKYPRGYQALVGGGSLKDATGDLGGQWFGLQKTAKAQKEFDSALSDRANMNAAMSGKVNSTGQLDVNVRAPQGTSVKAEGGGIFQKTDVRRHIQMQPSSGGPLQTTP